MAQSTAAPRSKGGLVKRLVIALAMSLAVSTYAYADDKVTCKVDVDVMSNSTHEKINTEVVLEKGFMDAIFSEPIYLEDRFGKSTSSFLTLGAGGNGNGLTDSEIVGVKLNKNGEEIYRGTIFSDNGKFRSVSLTTLNGSSVLVSINCK